MCKKHFSSRRRVISGLSSQLSVNGEVVFERVMWDRKYPPILRTLKKYWSGAHPEDEIILRLISRENTLEYRRDHGTGKFIYHKQTKTTEDERQQYKDGFMPGLDGRCAYWKEEDNDKAGAQEYPFGTCILFTA